MTAEPKPSQRIDKWLWHARIFKTRTLAGEFAASGKIRLRRADQSARVAKASHIVTAGDVLTFQLGDRIRIIEVLGVANRRGPARDAQALYNDLSPPATKSMAPRAATPERIKGAGRPTKKDRRVLERLRGE